MKFIFAFLFLFSALSGRSQYIQDSIRLNDGYLHFYTKGIGRPIVLLQGGPGFSSYYMRDIADSLVGYQCILIDYEGTGRSQHRNPDTSWVSPEKVIEDIELVRKKLNIPAWDLIGHSYGTHFGLYYAIVNPNRVDKIILISSIGTNNKFQRYANDNAMTRLTSEDMSQLGSIESDPNLNTVEKEFKLQGIFLKSYFFNKNKIEGFLTSVPSEEKSIYFSNGFFNVYFDHSNFWKWDISENAYALNKAVRIIQGRQDFLNDGTQEIMNLRMKDSKITYVERAGHFPWIERPEVFFKILREVLVK